MEAEEWGEIERLFHELSDLPPDEQRRRLEQQCRHLFLPKTPYS